MKFSYLWTSEINHNLEKKIMSCFDKTFTKKSSRNYFKWKYRDNPFGDSLHIVVLIKDKVIASRAFWRLDINKNIAYQCVDTAVMPNFQKKGIFKKTIIIAKKILRKKLIYNSPNENSGPAYLKCGWRNIDNSNLTKINITSLMLKSSPTIGWNFQTLKWRFSKNPTQKYYSLKKGEDYYIFRKIRKRFFLLIGKTKINLKLKNVNPFLCFSYDNECVGLPVKFRQPWMCKSKINYEFKSYLFDET